MAGPVTAALLLTAYSTLSDGRVDALPLIVGSLLQKRNEFALLLTSGRVWQAGLAMVGIATVAALLVIFARMTGSAAGTQQWTGPGKVLLFPARTTHSRMFPQKHRFAYPYLTVGIPVGWEGTAGGMVSVSLQGNHGLLSWFRPGQQTPQGWFDVNAGDYLERGQAEVGLRGKLDNYLRTQGVDPAIYPHAYLVTAARFLGYHFNPVSFWYLYDADKCLAAMILEVNNTFGERRPYLLVPDGDAGNRIKTKQSNGTGRVRETLKKSWPKDFHVSPFNSRKGSYSLTATDPLKPGMQGTGPLSNTINLISSKEHAKLVATLVSDGDAVDPYAMSMVDKFKFLVSWGWVGFLTFPRILKEAAALFFRRKLHVWFRPEPLKESLGRVADATESQLEPIFRSYLRHLVEQSSASLVVKYVAGGILEGATETMMSPRAAESKGKGSDELEFRVLTPVFYSRFVGYAHDMEAFFCELNESCTISVSRPHLLPKIALKKPLQRLESSMLMDEYAYFKLIQLLRTRPARIERPLTSSTWAAERSKAVDIREFRISSMDSYVLVYGSPDMQGTYKRCVLKLFLADRIAFGMVPLLEAQRFVLQAGLAWQLSSMATDLMGKLAVSSN